MGFGKHCETFDKGVMCEQRERVQTAEEYQASINDSGADWTDLSTWIIVQVFNMLYNTGWTDLCRHKCR